MKCIFLTFLYRNQIVNPTDEFLFAIPAQTYTSSYLKDNVDLRYRGAYEYMKNYMVKDDAEGFGSVYNQ